MILDPFQSSRIKIARARTHLALLDRAVAAFFADVPFALIVERAEGHDADTFAWTVRIRRAVPADWSAIIGDVVHNLRTSLDLMASDLVRIAGKNPKGVYFPFAENAAGLSEMIKKKNFNRAGPDAVAFLKEVKPYRGGNVVLRTLHDLDVQDKHQALIPTGKGMSIDLRRLRLTEAPSATQDELKNWSTRVEMDGQTTVLIPAAWSPPLGSEIEATFVLTLDYPGIGGEELITGLDKTTKSVEIVLGYFERLSKP